MSAVCQVQAFTSKAAVAPRQSRSRVVRVAAVQQQAPSAPLRFLAAGLAAAAVATCGSPAEAGVVLVQPEVKNFVKDTPAKAKEAAAPGEKKAAAPKAAKQYEEESAPPGGSFEALRPFALPVSILLVGAGGAAAAKLDPEFATMFAKTWSAKDSISTGAGYETAPGMKDGALFGGNNTGAKPKAKAPTGTKKVKTTAVAKKSSVLGSIFGSRD